MGRTIKGQPLGFERIADAKKYESSQYEQSLQWRRAEQGPLLDVSKLYKAGIFKKHYVSNDIPVITVGTNFYRLSGKDMANAIRSFDVVHNYTAYDGKIIRILDGVTYEEIGTYGVEGLITQ